MSKPQRILIVEIRTLENPDIDSSQLSTLTVHREEERLYLDSIDVVRTAIVDGVVHLGSNYRHPLLFDVQVIPTNDPGFDKSPSKGRRRRKRKSNKI